MRALAATLCLAACGTAATAVPTGTTPATTTTDHTIPVPPRLTELASAGRATMPAIRVDPPDTVAPFDPVGYVNALPYGWQNMGPAMDAFRVVATARGWTAIAIDRWTPFVYDVIVKESGGCPNTIGGDLFVVGTCDQYTRHGHAEDSGIGQLTFVLYGPSGPVCKATGLCSQQSIIATPWASIVSMVATLELLGQGPYCYDARSRGYHDCTLIGRTERPLT